MYGKIKNHLQNELDGIVEAGLFKSERIITSPQSAEIELEPRILTLTASPSLPLACSI